MQIFVKLACIIKTELHCKTLTLEVEPYHTTSDIFKMIEQKESIPTCMMRKLQYGNKYMHDNDTTVKEYGIEKEQTVYLDFCLGNGLSSFQSLEFNKQSLVV